MTATQDFGSDEISQTKTKPKPTNNNKTPKSNSKPHFIHFTSFTTEIYKTTELESIVPSKEGATGIQSQHLTQALFTFVFKETVTSNLPQFRKILQN